MMKDSETKKTRKHIQNINSGNSSKSWKSFDHLFRKKKAEDITQILDPETGTLESDELKIANIFKNSQKNIFEGNPTLDVEHENRVNLWYDRLRFHHTPIQVYFEKAEISKKLKI